MLPLRSRISVLAVCGALLTPLSTTVATASERAGSHGPDRRCVAPDARLTVEERWLDGPAPRELLDRSGFDRHAPALGKMLCRVKSARAAERIVQTRGRALWERAVDRAQGRGPAGGDLARDDDRPLYWARLEMSRAIREWRPAFPLTDERREALLAALERSSRGQDSMDAPVRPGTKRVIVTGFDPFQLDQDIRRSNPSGAAALALDGTTVRTATGPARIEVAVFPVRWADFTEGTVEAALRPHLPDADLFTTVSQGRPGQFDVERYNGAWRGGYPDNLNESVTEQIPVPGGEPGPQWTTTTLPYKEIAEADTGAFPVLDNTTVTEIPAGETEPVVSEDGPTPGSTARAGGGGNYLSNEIAYRATLLRDAAGLDVPGGHLHTPVLEFAADNTDPETGTVTDPVFLRNRAAITEQVRAIVRLAAGV